MPFGRYFQLTFVIGACGIGKGIAGIHRCLLEGTNKKASTFP